MSCCRTGNLDPNSYKAIGNLFEKLTCKWKGVKNLNDDNDNYEVPIDHPADSEGKVLQTGGRSYNILAVYKNGERAVKNFWLYDLLLYNWRQEDYWKNIYISERSDNRKK